MKTIDLKKRLQTGDDGHDFFSREMIASFENAARPTDEELEYCLRAADLPHDAAAIKVAREVWDEDYAKDLLHDAFESLSDEDRELLGSLATRDDAGRHFTQIEKYTPEFLEKMERLGLIVIHKPVHTESGVAFSEEYWQIESPACIAQFFQEE